MVFWVCSIRSALQGFCTEWLAALKIRSSGSFMCNKLTCFAHFCLASPLSAKALLIELTRSLSSWPRHSVLDFGCRCVGCAILTQSCISVYTSSLESLPPSDNRNLKRYKTSLTWFIINSPASLIFVLLARFWVHFLRNAFHPLFCFI